MEADVTEPVITISNEDPQIKVVVTDDTALDHVTYQYGDLQEQIIRADSADPTTIEFNVLIKCNAIVLDSSCEIVYTMICRTEGRKRMNVLRILLARFILSKIFYKSQKAVVCLVRRHHQCWAEC